MSLKLKSAFRSNIFSISETDRNTVSSSFNTSPLSFESEDILLRVLEETFIEALKSSLLIVIIPLEESKENPKLEHTLSNGR